MYKTIVNPKTNRQVNINTRLGRRILKRYYSHYIESKNARQQAGSAVPAILAVVAIGKLGYYYFYPPPLNITQDITDLNSLSYLKNHYPALAKQINEQIVYANQIMKTILIN